MRAAVRLASRGAAVLAFGATAALAITLNRPAPAPAAMTTASHVRPTPKCTGAGLAISLAPAPETLPARTRYPVEFTNTSATACTLTGYPQVAAYDARGSAYAQVGNDAIRVESAATAHRVVLRPGATAHSDVDLSTAGLPQKACKKVTVTGLRVVAPGETTPRYLRHQVTACSARGSKAPAYLHVRAVQPGMPWP
jgi:hypothetical protein